MSTERLVSYKDTEEDIMKAMSKGAGSLQSYKSGGPSQTNGQAAIRSGIPPIMRS